MTERVEIGPCTLIYALVDPRDGRVRYVGKTSQTMRRRLKAHMLAAAKGQRREWSARWVASVMRSGMEPKAVVLQVVQPGGSWIGAERRWIARFKRRGCELTNLTNGGEGTTGYRRGLDFKMRMSMALRKGRTHLCALCGWMVHRKPKDSRMSHVFCSRKCYASWQKGKQKKTPPKTLSHIKKIGLAHRRLSKVGVEKAVEMNRRGMLQREIAESLGLSQSAVSKVLRNASYYLETAQ